jgi:ABC-2 family transporter protein
MIWLTWRQFRTQAIVAGSALAAVAIYLVVLGLQIRHSYQTDVALCHGPACGSGLAQFEDRYQNRLYLIDAGLLALPGILGAFWGAPLVARELEAGTHRLVWNQSVTRRRWLAAKLLLPGLASAAAVGLVSGLLTWAASPVDQVAGDRFSALLFGTRNIVPVAYAVFGFGLGAVLGLVVRRTVPAMALTVLVFTVVQVLTPGLVRPHLSTPVTGVAPLNAGTVQHLSFLGADGSVGGLRIPDAWVVSTSRMLAADGQPIDPGRVLGCPLDVIETCVAQLDVHVVARYQPASRYWEFQWLESALFLGFSLLLAALGLWRIRAA